MRHGGEPAPHALRLLPPARDGLLRHRSGIGLREVDEVEQVLLDEAVIHRAELEVAAVGEHLFRELPREDAEAGLAPGVSLLALEKEAGEDERVGVG